MATGGIGGFLAARLIAKGHDVITIARGAHLEAIRDKGLTLKEDAGVSVWQPSLATDATSNVGVVDAILFGVKGDGLEAAAEACKPMLGPETMVVPFLNGVEAADRLLQILPPENVLNGLAQVSAAISAPGEITRVGQMHRFIFAERDSQPSARVAALQAALESAGVEAPVTEDVDADVWMKFLLFAAVSGVTAAGRCRMSDIHSNPETSAVFRSITAEVAALARARGVKIAPDAEDKIWAYAQGLPRHMRASTAIDLEKGLPLETRWVNGAVVRLAEAAGLDVPVNRTIAGILAPHVAGRL